MLYVANLGVTITRSGPLCASTIVAPEDVQTAVAVARSRTSTTARAIARSSGPVISWTSCTRWPYGIHGTSRVARPVSSRHPQAPIGGRSLPQLVHVLALGSAVVTAGATILIRLGFRGADAFTSYWINLVVGTAGLWLAVLVAAPSGPTELHGILYFVLAGLVGTTAGRLLRFVSIDRMGASVAAALTNLHPFIAAGLAILLLGESVTAPILAGTAVIVAGTVLLSAGGRILGFRPSQLVFPFLSAACFGAVAILRKLGLGGAGPLLGFAVNVTTALVAFTVFLAASGHLRRLRCEPPSLGYLIAAGVLENFGVLLGVLALRVGTVSVVAPLSGTMPLFVLALSWVFLRDIERINARLVTGTLLIVLGVYLITAL
ncbi:MAG: EamA family transporter [Myxococcaceae bacterium]